MELLYILFIGAISGWLAGQIWKGYGFGLLGNIIIGIVGSFIGGWLFHDVFHISNNIVDGHPTINVIIMSVVGAVLLLAILGLFRRR